MEAAPGGGLVALLAGDFAFFLTDDSDVLGSIAEAGLVFQVDGQLPGLLKPGPGLGQSAYFLFDHAEGVVDPHHRRLIARLLKAL